MCCCSRMELESDVVVEVARRTALSPYITPRDRRIYTRHSKIDEANHRVTIIMSQNRQSWIRFQTHLCQYKRKKEREGIGEKGILINCCAIVVFELVNK